MTDTKAYRKQSDAPAWRKRWRIDQCRGVKRIVPADAAQAHVQQLVQRHSVTLRGIAEAAGISAWIVSDLNRGIKPSIHRDTEKAILAVTPDSILARHNADGLVLNVGGRRRIQALLVMGWRHQDLAPMLGMNTSNIIHQPGDWFTKRKHDAIKELYDRLWDKRGPATALSINRIAKAGYAPPLAWDDETIDDPNTQPNLGAKVYAQGRAPENALKKANAVIEDTEYLLDAGHGWVEIPARLGTTADALERSLHRSGRSDLISRARTLEERRAYARAS